MGASMKISRLVIVIVLLVVLAVLAWKFMPGVRQKAVDVYREHGGWTEEARRADPVGFIEYAEGELQDDLAALEQTRVRITEARKTLASELDKHRSLLKEAEQLAATFREAYRQAETGPGYPVRVSGRDYGKDELIRQVRLILLQRESYEQIIDDMEAAAENLTSKKEQLVTQITATKAALSSLPAKKEIARVNELTGRTREIFQQANELIGKNRDVLAESPVRTVEELSQRGKEGAATAPQGEVDARAFLEASE